MGRSQSSFLERASWLLRLPLETPTIPFEDERSGCTLWLKLDYLLPSGCTKDRMATNIVAYAIASGEVSPSTVVVEASSGSTSIALSMACATVGVPFRAYMPKTVSGERVLMIRRLGGEVVLTPAAAGHGWSDRCIAPGLGDRGRPVRRPAVREPAQRVRASALDRARAHPAGRRSARRLRRRCRHWWHADGRGACAAGPWLRHGHRSSDADCDLHCGGRPGGRRGDTGHRRGHEPAPRPWRRWTRGSCAGPGAGGTWRQRANSVVAAWASARRAGSTSPQRGGLPPALAPGTTSARSCPTGWSGTSRLPCSTTWRLSSSALLVATSGGAALAYSSKSDVCSSRSGRTWMKYSTPNISPRIRSGNMRRIDRILGAMCGRGPDLVADEVGDVDARAHSGVDLVP